MITTSYPILYGWSVILAIYLLLLLSMFIIKKIAEKLPQKAPTPKKKAGLLQAEQTVQSNSVSEDVKIAIAIALLAQKGVVKAAQNSLLPHTAAGETPQKVSLSRQSNRVNISMWREFPGKTPKNWNTSKFPLQKQKAL